MQAEAKQPLSGFELGEIVITATAMEVLPSPTIMEAIDRHAAGDWGELPPEDLQANELALRRGGRLFSAYTTEEGTRFWIITEADRSVTTILLPEDY